jgi:uncharacterized membrane protein
MGISGVFLREVAMFQTREVTLMLALPALLILLLLPLLALALVVHAASHVRNAKPALAWDSASGRDRRCAGVGIR